jgi:hypothetical protein
VFEKRLLEVDTWIEEEQNDRKVEKSAQQGAS